MGRRFLVGLAIFAIGTNPVIGETKEDEKASKLRPQKSYPRRVVAYDHWDQPITVEEVLAKKGKGWEQMFQLGCFLAGGYASYRVGLSVCPLAADLTGSFIGPNNGLQAGFIIPFVSGTVLSFLAGHWIGERIDQERAITRIKEERRKAAKRYRRKSERP